MSEKAKRRSRSAAGAKPPEAAPPEIPPVSEFPEEPAIVLEHPATLRVKWGDELHFPVKYNSLNTGELELTIAVPAGADLKEIHRQTLAKLEQLGHEQFKAKLKAWSDRYQMSQRAGRSL